MQAMTIQETDAGEGAVFALPECTLQAPEGKEFRGWELTEWYQDKFWNGQWMSEVRRAEPTEQVRIASDTVIKAIWKDIGSVEVEKVIPYVYENVMMVGDTQKARVIPMEGETNTIRAEVLSRRKEK